MKEVKEMPGIVKAAFREWGSRNTQYSKLFKSLPKEVLEIAADCFDEVRIYIPGSFEVWWASQHNRYIRKVKQKDITVLHELIYNFLCDLVNDRLMKNDTREVKRNVVKSKKPEVKATTHA